MLQTTYIQENSQDIIDRLTVRGIDATETINQIISLDNKRKATQAELDSTLAEANKLAKEIGGLFKQGRAEEANAAKYQKFLMFEDDEDSSSTQRKEYFFF